MYPSVNPPYTPTVNLAETSVAQNRMATVQDMQAVHTEDDLDVNDDVPPLEEVNHTDNHDVNASDTMEPRDDPDSDQENMPPLCSPDEAPDPILTIFFRSPRPDAVLLEREMDVSVTTMPSTLERDDDTVVSDISTISIDGQVHGPFPKGQVYTYCDDTLYVFNDAAYVGPSPLTVQYNNKVYTDVDTSSYRTHFRAHQHCFELVESTLSMVRQTFRQPSPYYLGDPPPYDEIPRNYSHALQLDYFGNSNQC